MSLRPEEARKLWKSLAEVGVILDVLHLSSGLRTAWKSPMTPQGVKEREEAERVPQKALLRLRSHGAWTAVSRKEVPEVTNIERVRW